MPARRSDDTNIFRELERQATAAAQTGKTTVPLDVDGAADAGADANVAQPAARREPTTQLNVSIRKALHRKVKHQLFLEEERSFVSLVEELFEKWLKEKGIEP